MTRLFMDGVADGMQDAATRRAESAASNARWDAEEAERKARNAADDYSTKSRKHLEEILELKKRILRANAGDLTFIQAVRTTFEKLDPHIQHKITMQLNEEIKIAIPQTQEEQSVTAKEVVAAMRARLPKTLAILGVNI